MKRNVKCEVQNLSEEAIEDNHVGKSLCHRALNIKRKGTTGVPGLIGFILCKAPCKRLHGAM